MHWIKEVEIAKSIDDLMTSQSVEGREFPDCDGLDAMTASALKNLLTHVHFRERVSVEEQRAQKRRPILTKEANEHANLRNNEQQSCS